MKINYRSGKKYLLLLSPLFFSLYFAGCASYTPPGHKGLSWHPFSSGLSEKVLPEGWYWRLPWNDVMTLSVQWQNYSETIEVLTKDDLHIEVEASVIARPVAADIHNLILEIGADFYPRVLKPEFFTVVRSILAGYNMVVIPEKSPEVENLVLVELRKRIKGKYIELDKISLNHIKFTPRMLRAIENKLAHEQISIQKDFEKQIALKNAEISRIDARGEGDSLRILAEGAAEAQKIRAGGQAEAQRLISKTLTPQYIQFKAFDSANSKFIYVPTGSEGLPVVISPELK